MGELEMTRDPREFVDGEPDSQGSKIVKARSPSSSEMSENRPRLRAKPSVQE